jgi:hypothetical protein
MMSKRAIYIIESGKPLEMIKHHIAERIRVKRSVIELLNELGCENREVWTDRQTGVLTAISAKRGQQPDGFTVPDSRGKCWPKKGTEWAKRFSSQHGFADSVKEIAEAFNVPLSISFTSQGHGEGWRHIGYPLSECGYLFTGEDGPYAMWIPDVAAIVSDMAREGDTVTTSNALMFSMVIDGCRRIDHEEWEIMVMQHKLEKKKAKREMAGAA